jgi:hypothetical protein
MNVAFEENLNTVKFLLVYMLTHKHCKCCKEENDQMQINEILYCLLQEVNALIESMKNNKFNIDAREN